MISQFSYGLGIFGGIWEELAKSKENQGTNQKKKD